jgi:hypothetical protein
MQPARSRRMWTESLAMTLVEGDDIAFSRVENAQEFLPARVGQISQDGVEQAP